MLVYGETVKPDYLDKKISGQSSRKPVWRRICNRILDIGERRGVHSSKSTQSLLFFVVHCIANKLYELRVTRVK